MKKKLVLHSGGQDSTSIMLDYIAQHGAENIISLGFNYGQRHFEMENKAAYRLCDKHNIIRVVLDAPIGQIGGCSLVDHSIDVTTNMEEQRSTVVPNRNAIFLMIAAAVAQVNDCDVITHGACIEDYAAYRDCRPEFFDAMQLAIQAGLTNTVLGSEDMTEDIASQIFVDGNNQLNMPETHLDIRIETPLIKETKDQTLARILRTHDASVYEDSYTCYNGGEVQCGRCPACVERQVAFYINKVKDPLEYENPLSDQEIEDFLAG